MNDKEFKEILNDPKKIVDLIRAVHRLLHVYDAQEIIKEKLKTPGQEKVGLNDQLNIQLNHQEVKQ